MEATIGAGGAQEAAYECFGVTVALRANDGRAMTLVRSLAPPRSVAGDPGRAEHRFGVLTEDGSSFNVRWEMRAGEALADNDPSSWVAYGAELDYAMGLLEDHWRGCIAYNAPDHIFVEAGVVAHRGRAIVMPGMALSGKTTLVDALVRAGAEAYSDEYAAIDAQGLVHPYGRDDAAPLPVGAVFVTSYRPGAPWSPRRLSAGEAAIALMARAIPGQKRSQQSMAAIRSALATGPLALECERDDAEATAGLLLAEIDREAARSG